jgi:hypothetical protein
LATALDIKLAPLAGQLIGEFGKTLQYNKRGSSNYDAYTATTILSEVVSFTIKGLVENYMRPTDHLFQLMTKKLLWLRVVFHRRLFLMMKSL